MIDCNKIKEIAQAQLADTDLFVVSCTCSPANEIDLHCLRQYRKLTGRPVEVLLTGGTRLLATLLGADAEGIDLSYPEKQAVEGKKRRQTVEVTRRFTYDEIKWTREHLDYK